MYTMNRLEWHQGETLIQPRRVLCGLVRQQARFLISVNRLVVALAKSQDHRASCGVFSFGRPNDSRYVTGPAWCGKSRNTAPRYTPRLKANSVGQATVKAYGNSGGKLGRLYKRIDPSGALGAFCDSFIKELGEGRKRIALIHPRNFIV